MKSVILFFIASCFFLPTREANAQTVAAAGNLPSKTTSQSLVVTGLSVVGVFDGKWPCQEIARELGILVVCQEVNIG